MNSFNGFKGASRGIIFASKLKTFVKSEREMSSIPKLYMDNISPPVRCVLLTVKATDIAVEKREIRLLKGDTFTPEYKKINPEHTIPTLDDNGFILSDSHVIASYLIDKYRENSPLYPRDFQKRATIQSRLHFDTGMLFPYIKTSFIRCLTNKSLDIPEEEQAAIEKAYGFLEDFLHLTPWMAGQEVTIADHSLIASVTTANALMPVNPEAYPRLREWMKKCENLPYYAEGNQEGLNRIYKILNKVASSPKL